MTYLRDTMPWRARFSSTMPKRSELPEELRPLCDYQAVAISTSGFRSDMAGLRNDIRAIPGSSSWWPRFGAGLAAAVVFAAGIWGAPYLLGSREVERFTDDPDQSCCSPCI